MFTTNLFVLFAAVMATLFSLIDVLIQTAR